MRFADEITLQEPSRGENPFLIYRRAAPQQIQSFDAIAYSCCGLLSYLFFVRFDPCIKISFIKSPAFVEANFAQPVADNFLFEAVTCQPASTRRLPRG
jgi:hypothetical protein